MQTSLDDLFPASRTQHATPARTETPRAPAELVRPANLPDSVEGPFRVATPWSATTALKAPMPPPPQVSPATRPASTGLYRAAAAVADYAWAPAAAGAATWAGLRGLAWGLAHPTSAAVGAAGTMLGVNVLMGIKQALWGMRPDGTPVPISTLMRRMMPFLMPRRNDAWIRYTWNYDLTHTQQKIRTWNATHDEDTQITLFHVMMAALLWANQRHPGLNRFVAGNRIYERNEMATSFAVKSRKKLYASLRTVKFRAQVGETFEAMVRRLNRAIDGERKGGKRNASEREMAFFLHLPDVILSAAVRLQSFLDHHGLWPKSLIDGDPLYASIFAANLGSLHPEAMRDVAHHLYEYGTVSLFAAICSAELDGPKPFVKVNWTYDERVNDAHYCLMPLLEGQRLLEGFDGLMQPVTQAELDAARHHEHSEGREAAAREA